MNYSATYNIGAEAIGGTIKVDVTGKVVRVTAINSANGSEINSGTITLDQYNWKELVYEYLNYLTTETHARRIIRDLKNFVNILLETS